MGGFMGGVSCDCGSWDWCGKGDGTHVLTHKHMHSHGDTTVEHAWSHSATCHPCHPCSPRLPFMPALAAFKHRILMANVRHDRCDLGW